MIKNLFFVRMRFETGPARFNVFRALFRDAIARYVVAALAIPALSLSQGCGVSPEVVSAAPEVQHSSERDPNRLWCNEHGLYEDECVLCHPELADQTASDTDHDHQTADSVGLMCEEHEVLESDCGICHPELLRGKKPGEGLKVRFPSPDAASRAGVTFGRPESATMDEAVDALGRLSYNQNMLALVTPLAGGVLQSVTVDVGDRVKAGQLLAEVASPQIANAKGTYLEALTGESLSRQMYEREKDLVERRISARQDFETAKAEYEVQRNKVQNARQQLINLGFTDEEIAQVVQTRSTTSILPVRTPFDGTVIARDAVMGSAVEPGTPLFEVADLSTMWLELSVSESHLPTLKEGARVTARFDAYPGEVSEGELAWIAYSIDEQTRRVEARAVMPNPGARLKQGMFAKARIASPTPVVGIAIPEDAVQVVDGLPIVFARLADDLFETRVVELGNAQDRRVSVRHGLHLEDQIAISQTHVLKSELLKARLGAGCADE